MALRKYSMPVKLPQGMSRRQFLYLSALAGIGAACGNGATATTTTAGPGTTTTGAVGTTGTTAAGVSTTAGTGGAEPQVTFVEPREALSGELRILLWSHFVPAHDTWFDPFVQEWGEQVGVNVTVDHIAVADVPAAIAAEIQSGQPQHDLMQYIAVLSQHEPSTVDMADVVAEAESRYGTMLDLCRRSSLNPNTGKYYAYAPAWVPDPGDYRRSLWEGGGDARWACHLRRSARWRLGDLRFAGRPTRYRHVPRDRLEHGAAAGCFGPLGPESRMRTRR